jgi:superfamily II RNA helicase
MRQFHKFFGVGFVLIPCQYVIFDEVHSIGGEGGGVWSRLLTLIKCPFLALSATIGNIDDFGKWLGELHEKQCVQYPKETSIFFCKVKFNNFLRTSI